jgi:hypothetical protein
MSKILLTDLQYLPSLAFWQTLAGYDTVCLEQSENYVKGSPRNRCAIASSNGLLRLSVPLQQGKNQQQGIRDVRIANETAWQRQHWRSINSAYGSAPFWTHYDAHFQPFYTKKYDFLWDFNHDLFILTLKLLKLKPEIIYTQTYEKASTESEKYDDIRYNKKYENPEILLTTQPYPQIFSAKYGFIPDLSIIDGLFCMGISSLQFCSTNAAMSSTIEHHNE